MDDSTCDQLTGQYLGIVWVRRSTSNGPAYIDEIIARAVRLVERGAPRADALAYAQHETQHLAAIRPDAEIARRIGRATPQVPTAHRQAHLPVAPTRSSPACGLNPRCHAPARQRQP